MNRDIDHASSNLRQIGLALFEFQSVYGKFPEVSTVPSVKSQTGYDLSLGGESSNDLFAQLLASEIAGSEHIFYIRRTSATRPDNIWNSDLSVLSNGECTFAYIPGVDPKGNPNTPIAFGPAIPGDKHFNQDLCGGMVAVLTLDRRVVSYPIDAKGNIIYHGMSILDPRQPFWKGKAPDVRWPK